MKWRKETPAEDGVYWIKYKNAKNALTICPCEVWRPGDRFGPDTVTVNTFYHDFFIEGPKHGGPGLKFHGKLHKAIWFGDKMPYETSEEAMQSVLPKP